jgi:nitrate reductase NapAB chaperone NapD
MSAPRHISGILVVVEPGRAESCRTRLEALPGVEVHYLDEPGGRIVAVQETATASEQEQGLRRIQQLAGVRLAALVEHRIDRAEEDTP